MKHVLIVPEYWLPHVHYMVQAFRQCEEDLGVRVWWTNERWWRNEEHGPKSDTERVNYLPPETAIPMLERGHFDAVVFSEGTLLAFMCANTPAKTRRIFLDSADHGYVVKPFFDAVDVYLKCQHPPLAKPILIGDSTNLGVLANQGKLITPWPYCASAWIDESMLEERRSIEPAVHFRGSCWPMRRVEAVKALSESGIDIRGGFYDRAHLAMRATYPENLRATSISFQEHLAEMRSCQLALNTIGNGEMCFRACEIMQAGVCMVTQPISIEFPGRAPRHMEECVICPDDSSLVEACRWLLANPDRCAEIGAAGRSYWETFQSPRAWARRFADVLESTLSWQ